MNNSGNHQIWSNTFPTARLIDNPGKKIAILIHINPDGDAIGSSLALSLLFRKIGHECTVISPNDYPVFLKWMPGTEHLLVFKHSPSRCLEILKSADIIFGLDFNELKRVKELNEGWDNSKAHKVLIDHHPGPDIIVDCLLSDTSASSTAELVYRFIVEAGLQQNVDKDIASCIFTGIMTDTGCFSYNSSNRKTWEVVAELLDFGIDKNQIYSLVYDNYSSDRMRLMGYGLYEKMIVLPEFRTGFIWLSRDDLHKFKFEAGDTEGFVNYPLSIRGIRFAALFIEKDNHVRISLRSKGDFPVNEFAKKYFNGGGHRNASGGESLLSLDETISRFKDLLPENKEKLCEYDD